MRFRFLFFFSLTAVVFVLYWPSLDNPLLFDDFENYGGLLRNYTPRPLFSILREIAPPWYAGRLLSEQSFLWLHAFSKGIFIQRLLNVGLHGANAMLLFFLMLRIFKSRQTAAFLALFFALNPVALYAVAYLSQRNILMVLFFGLLQALFFLRSLEASTMKKALPPFFLSLFFFFLAKASKEQAVPLLTLYPLLTLLDSRLSKRALVFNLPLLAGAVFFAVYFLGDLRPEVMDGRHAYLSNTIAIRLACGIPIEGLYAKSVITQLGLFKDYFLSWMFPAGLSVDMRKPLAGDFWIAWPLALSLLAAPLCLWKRSTRVLGVSLLLSVVLFSPELSRVRLGEIFVLYRSYLYSAGFLMILGFFVNPLRRFSRLAAFLPFLLLFPMGWGTLRELKTLKRPSATWIHAARQLSPELACQGARIYSNAGAALLAEGKPERAIPYLKKALEILPDYPASLINLGEAHFRLRDFAKAQSLFLRFVEGFSFNPVLVESAKGIHADPELGRDFLERAKSRLDGLGKK